MDIGKFVTVLIPAYNEAERIGGTVRAILATGVAGEVLVIDDASRDETARLARKAGARVIRHEKNLGKGGALNTGLKESRGGILALIDADLGGTASEVAKLVAPVLAGEADMTVAAFPKTGRKAGFGLVKGLARWGIRRYAGFEAQSPLSGQRAMRREVIEAVGGFASGFGVEVGLTIDAARKGFRILEVPVQMGHAATGRDLAGFLHRGKQFWQVGLALLRRM